MNRSVGWGEYSIAALAPRFDQHLPVVLRVALLRGPLRTLRQQRVAGDLVAAHQPVDAAARALLQVARLDPLDQVTQADLGGHELELVIGPPLIKLEQFEVLRDSPADGSE